MCDPREPHLAALRRILHDVRVTPDYDLQLYYSSTSSLAAYSKVHWVGCPTTLRSTSCYCVFLGNNLLSLSSKRQYTLSRSCTETGYRGVTNAVTETSWLQNLLRELHSSNPVEHQHTKHIKIDITLFEIRLLDRFEFCMHVPSHYQYTDTYTKGLLSALYDDFCDSLSI